MKQLDLIRCSQEDKKALPAELFTTPNLLQLNIATLKTVRGIYFLTFNCEIVYIGQSVNVLARIGCHISEGSKKFNNVYFLPVPKGDLTELERKYIHEIKPVYNKEIIAPKTPQQIAEAKVLASNEQAIERHNRNLEAYKSRLLKQ